MVHRILAATTASVSEPKHNPMGTVAAGEDLLVAELNHGAPGFYRVSAKACETLMDQLKDLELP